MKMGTKIYNNNDNKSINNNTDNISKNQSSFHNNNNNNIVELKYTISTQVITKYIYVYKNRYHVNYMFFCSVEASGLGLILRYLRLLFLSPSDVLHLNPRGLVLDDQSFLNYVFPCWMGEFGLLLVECLGTVSAM